MVSDPVGDFIIQLKNAGAVGKSFVVVPYSRLRHAVAGKLKERGYVSAVTKRGKKVSKSLEVVLRYDAAGNPVIHGVKRVSKPGRRLYKKMDEIRPVRYGKGTLILSTPQGILSGSEARKAKVGGEALFEIW
ncbi:MAG TPA: 30S ribosomal protein S8 [Candidatus Paceibacterota bacterium]|jgi:small subunit ribosomal protein S8